MAESATLMVTFVSVMSDIGVWAGVVVDVVVGGGAVIVGG